MWLITRDKELIPQDKILQTFISLRETRHISPLLQIPPKSINKLLMGFAVIYLALLKMLTVFFLHKSESLQEILFESFVTPYIVIRHELINIQGLTL